MNLSYEEPKPRLVRLDHSYSAKKGSLGRSMSMSGHSGHHHDTQDSATSRLRHPATDCATSSQSSLQSRPIRPEKGEKSTAFHKLAQRHQKFLKRVQDRLSPEQEEEAVAVRNCRFDCLEPADFLFSFLLYSVT